MKKAATGFFALILIIGLNMAGAEAATTSTQIFANVIGLVLLAAGGLAIWRINRKDWVIKETIDRR